MAYAAVISLKHTIKSLMAMDPSCYLYFSDSTPDIIQLLEKEVDLLQKALEELDGSIGKSRTERLNALDGEMREAVCELEDKLESLVLDQYQFFSQTGRSVVLYMDLQELKQDIDYFCQRMGKLKASYTHEVQYPSPEEDDDHHLGGDEYSEMVGLSDLYIQIIDRLTKDWSVPERMVVTLLGMSGMGKTCLANKLLHDPLFLTRFGLCVFVSIGPQYKLEGVLLDILNQVNPENVDHQKLLMEGEEKLDALKAMIHQGLEGRRYFVVLDDLWDMKLWYRHLVDLFIWRGDGSHVLVTTKMQRVADIADWGGNYRMRFMDKQESWDLLRNKVFGKEWKSCSYQLEKAWKKIAENCEGLPLTIVMVANILRNSSEEKSITYLNEIATDNQHPVFMDAYDQMFKVLYPNYNHLPQHLKQFFLYMGVFPQSRENPLLQLINLWYAEGFVESGHSGYTIFEELASRCLVMSTCTLHPVFWHMCKKIAARDKFFHSLNTFADVSAEDVMESQRRLCIHNNVLFGIQDANDLMASVSNVRSLLCTGPYHHYPVPIYLESWRLLRILHAISIRFYEFQEQVEKLVQLRYLALTYDGNLPPLISKLWNLRYLIIQRHLNIVESDGSSSYLPTEIWDMHQLIHLQVIGSNLPHPPRETSFLPYLSTLYDVSAQSCTKDVFERMPNLKNLGIQIELAPDDADEPLCVLDHISYLNQLRSLKCAVVSPVLRPACKAFALLSIFPSTLGDLTLSGLGYPWEEMSKISSLPNLTRLKLQCYAFRGPKWEVHDKGFRQLELLMIEDADLVHWTVEDYHRLEKLEWLSIRHCYNLKEIPLEFGEDFQTVELIDCNPLAVSCVKRLKVDLDRKYNCRRRPLELTVQSSWDI